MAGGERRVFGARMSRLPDSAEYVERFCDRHGIVRDDALRVMLIVEELFTNAVVHGYRGESDAPIVVHLSIQDGHVAILFEDAAPRFDPLSVPPVDLEAPLESRAVGGLGVHLIRQYASSARYAREDGRNRLWLRVPCASLAHAAKAAQR